MPTINDIDFLLRRFNEVDKRERGGILNKKVKGAKTIERDGIVFDSRLEYFMYNLLTMHRIDFIRQPKYILQDKFRYRGEAVRAITYTADYEIPAADMIIDTKGLLTQQGAVRIKMLKNTLKLSGREPRIELPQNQRECEALIAEIIDIIKQ